MLDGILSPERFPAVLVWNRRPAAAANKKRFVLVGEGCGVALQGPSPPLLPAPLPRLLGIHEPHVLLDNTDSGS